MDFSFSEEQTMLRDSVARLVQDDYDFETRTRIVAGDEGFSREMWQTFAELGWLSIPFAEEHGGFGGDPVATMLVMEEFGKGLVAEPFLPTVVLFGGLLAKAGTAAQQAAHIPAIIEGKRLGAVAYAERQGGYALGTVATTAHSTGTGFVLNGEKVMVLGGASAEYIIVSARTSGATHDALGVSLFLVPADAPGLERVSYRLMDGEVVANVRCTDVAVAEDQLVGVLDRGLELLESLAAEASVYIGAEGLGIMGRLHGMTVDYTKQREQFGVPIGSFQALQHRMVDMFMAYEQTRSLLYRAVTTLAEGSDEAAVASHALKVMLHRNGKHIGDEAIQLHGGMGLTDEFAVGHYVKRLMMLNTLFGNGDYHQQRFNALRYAG